MTLAAFLRLDTATKLRAMISHQELVLSKGWYELDITLRVPGVSLALVDPQADGTMNLQAVVRIIRRHPRVPVVGCVTVTPENFKAIAYLSKRGLSDVVVGGPSHDDDLRSLIHRMAGDHSAYEFLTMFEAQLERLEPRILQSVRDLFQQPHRYRTASDIGRERGVSVKAIYRAFSKAGLGTPKRFLTAAKVVRGFAYLRQNSEQIQDVSARVGYKRDRLFAERFREIFQCHPSELRSHGDSGEILAHLAEWLRRPFEASRKRSRS